MYSAELSLSLSLCRHFSSFQAKENLRGREGREMEMEERIGMRINENVGRDKDVRTNGIRKGPGRRRTGVEGTNLLCVSPAVAPDPKCGSASLENRGRQSV
jgi:hypothetical protein